MSKFQWSTTASENGSGVTDIDWSEGMAPSEVNDSSREAMAQEAAWMLDIGGANTTGGTAAALTLTTNAVIDSNRDGIILTFIAGATASADATLNVDGKGAKALLRLGGGGNLSGDVLVGAAYAVVYDASADGGSGGWKLLNASIAQNSTRLGGFDPEDFAILGASQTFTGNLTFEGKFVDTFKSTTSGNPATDAEAGVSLSGGGFVSAYRSGGAAGFFGRDTDGVLINFRHGGAGAGVGTIFVDSTSTTYNTTSDYRLKENVSGLANSGEFIDALRPVAFTWKTNGQSSEGFIAHEFAQVCPAAVNGVKDGEDMQAMQASHPEVMANVIAELQSLRARLAALED